MSGSGATCFGLFADAGRGGARRAALPGAWWRAAGGLTRRSGALRRGPADPYSGAARGGA